MSGRGTLQILVSEVTWMVRVALDKVRTPEAFVRWMAALGMEYEAPTLSRLAPTVDALEAAIVAAGRLDTERPVSEQASVYQDITTALVEALLNARTLPEDLADLERSVAALRPEDVALAALEDILATFLERRHPPSYHLLHLSGLVEVGAATGRRGFRFDRLETLFTEPAALMRELYAWDDDDAPFDFDLFAERVRLLACGFGIPARFEAAPAALAVLLSSPDSLRLLRAPLYEVGDPEVGRAELGLALSPAFDADTVRGLGIFAYASGDASITIPLGPPLSLTPSISADAMAGLGLTPRRGGIVATPMASAAADVGLRLRIAEEGSSLILFGDREASRFEVGGIELGFEARLASAGSEELVVELRVDEGAIIVAPGEGDGFLNKVLPPDGFRVDFAFLLGWSSKLGFYFGGSVGFEVTIPVQLQLGPIRIESVYLAARVAIDPAGAAPPGLEATVAATVSLEIGPVAGVIEEMGIQVTSPLPPSGFDAISLGFKPPKGVGLSISAGPVEGGGYLFIDTENERYAGIITLKIGEIGITAIGLITTRFPDGTKGFSLLGIINALFDPAISLSFGFFLGGIGGYVGIHRTMITEEVQRSEQDGSIDSILFPPDPIKNAPTIIENLRRIFPPERDRYLVGVAVRIVWGQPALVFIDLAVIIEIPSPIKIALFGRLSVILPDEDAELLALRFAIAGILDTEKKILSIDAGLYDSHVVGFPITGSMAMRARWGSDPMFIMAAGGFDKDFEPPADFPRLTPLGISIGASDNPRISLGGYFAITSNTVQFGARIDLVARAGDFSVVGHLAFATLFRFNPFYMRASMEATLSVRAGSTELMGVDVDLTLEGPGPWHAKGVARFKVLFVEINAGFDVEFGSHRRRTYPASDPFPTLVEELGRPESWQPVGGRIETIPGDGAPDEHHVIVPPDGHLEIRQRLLPLGIPVDKVGNVPTPSRMAFDVEVASSHRDQWASSELRDHFSPAQYQARNASQRLADKSYERYRNGLELRSQAKVEPRVVHVPVRYEVRVLKRKSPPKAPVGLATGIVPSVLGGTRPRSVLVGLSPRLPARAWATFAQGAHHVTFSRHAEESGRVSTPAGQPPLRKKAGTFRVVDPQTGQVKTASLPTRAEAEVALSELSTDPDNRLAIFGAGEFPE
ncbi:MAG: DUF6603 domain-containing protein [Polyangiaceae bacterium]